MDESEPNFEIWLFRRGDAEPVFDIKFQTRTGRGLFRTPQTSGVSSTPAGMTGEIKGLDSTELIQTSFIHVHESRLHLTFSQAAHTRLSTLPIGEWIAITVHDSGHLEFPAEPSVMAETKPSPVTKLRSKGPASSSERKSAADHILDLEDQLSLSRRHIDALKERVAHLEDQVEGLGGELTPLLLDIGSTTVKNRG